MNEVPTESLAEAESIFHEARELPPERRSVFLDGACRGDAKLRREIDALLDCDVDDDPLFRSPFPDGTIDQGGDFREGTTLGPYKLLQPIGEGGFGAVYMAEQFEPVRRKVALKVIKPGMDSKEVIARFEAERQALAMMEHPNIAKVLDAGTSESGRPYFVMELVKGVSITQYCDDNQLEMPQRLSLFRDVCRAIHHAHQKGIIHRDLKPSNILVTLHDGAPVPKVIDFGVSKALSQPLTDKTLFTRYGQIIGTPQYMSPEQAEMSGLDVDTRSDIYSLGVLLYELLTGHTPIEISQLKKAGYEAMRSLIRDSEPTRPSLRVKTLDKNTASSIASHRSTQPIALAKSLNGDLDWIVLKSLEKDRNRRYSSAHDLARDVGRYLENETIEAGPPTLKYQLGKFLRRNRVAATILGIIAFSGIASLSAVTLAWLQAVDANQQTQQALIQSKESEEKAELAAETARTEALRAQTSLRLLTDLISGAKPSGELGSDIPVSEFLELFAKKTDEASFDDSQVEIPVRQTLGRSFSNFSQFEQAAGQFAQALALGNKLFDQPNFERAKFLLDHSIAVSGSPATKEGHVIDLLTEALEILDEGDGDQVVRVQVLVRLGYAWRDKPEVATPYLRRACEMTDSLDAQERTILEANPYGRLAEVLISQEQTDESIIAVEHAIDLAQEQHDLPGEIQHQIKRIELHAVRREFQEAEQVAEDALQSALKTKDAGTLHLAIQRRIEREFYRPEITSIEVARRLAGIYQQNWELLQRASPSWSLGHVAGALLTLGDVGEAEDMVALSTKLSPYHQMNTKRVMAQWLRTVGRLQEADDIYAEVFESRFDKTNREALWDLIWRERSHTGVRDFQAGIKFLEETEKRAAESTAKNNWTRYASVAEHAVLLATEMQTAESIQLWNKTLLGLSEESDRLWGSGTLPLLVLAAIESGTPRKEWPEVVERAVAELREGIETSWDQAVAYRHVVLAKLAILDGDKNTAIDGYEQAVRSRQRYFQQIYFEWVIDEAVELMVAEGELDRAETMLREDIAKCDEVLMWEGHPERAFTRIRLVDFLLKNRRDLRDAKEHLKEAADVFDLQGDFMPSEQVDALVALQVSVGQQQ